MAVMHAFSPVIGPVKIDVVISEKHDNSLGITSDPIETGAEINDHAYIKPKKLSLRIGSNTAAETFNALVAFQETRVPFSIVSGLFVYNNMLIERLTADRDATTSRVLSGSADLSEIIIVDTGYATVDDSAEQNADKSGKPGGANSTKSARPTATRAGDPTTADRVDGTVQRGDSPTTPTDPDNVSGLKRIFG